MWPAMFAMPGKNPAAPSSLSPSPSSFARASRPPSLALELAQVRYNLGLGSIVEFTQAELQETDAEIQDTDAKYQYRLTQLALAFTIAAPK
jgi:outer membrane protein TolC